MEIDYVGERGLGAWIRARREKRGLSRRDVAQAASVSDKTVERYESDVGLSYETIRVLDALGVKWSAGPMRSAPSSVNVELARLRRSLEELGAVEPPVWHEDLSRRLEALQDTVDEWTEQVARTLERLGPAIAGLEDRLDAAGVPRRSVPPAAGKDGRE